MGTTRTSLQDGSNPELVFCLTLEGYDQVICSSRTHLAEVASKYSAATDYTQAISGLQRPGVIEQSLVPLRPRIEANSVAFVVYPDANETLAVDLWRTDKTGGIHSKLNAKQDPSDNVLTMTASTGSWASSGAGYIGGERLTYTGKSGSTLTGCVRGLPVPFGRNAAGTRWGRQHRVSQVSGGVVSRPTVSDYPKAWIGKWVACRVHRVVDGTLDAVAQSELIFAGRLADITENEQGAITLTCLDARDAVASGVLLGDQYSASPTFGIHIDDGSVFKLTRFWVVSGSLESDSYTYTIGGSYLAEGYYTADQIVDSLNDFFSDQDYTAGAGDDSADWAALSIGDDHHVTVTVRMGDTGISSGWFRLDMDKDFALALGFDIENPDGTSDDPPYRVHYKSEGDEDNSSVVIDTYRAPLPVGEAPRIYGQGYPYVMERETGTFFNQGDWVPQPWKNALTTTTGSWGFFRCDDFVYIGQYDSGAGTITFHYDKALLQAFNAPNPFETIAPFDDYGWLNSAVARRGEGIPRVKQIALIEERFFEDWLRKTFYSTGEENYNHASYDKYPAQLGLAIPHDLLGTNFINTAKALGEGESFRVLIEQPTPAADIILPELTLRNAHLVMRDGAMMFARPTAIDAGSATHALTTSDKAAAPDHAPLDWPRVVRSRSSIVNIAKVEYDRDLSGNYHRAVEVSNEQSKTDYGQSQPVTVLTSQVQINRELGEEAIRDRIANLSGDMLTFHGKPMTVMSRSLAASKWFMTPGDTCTVTDDWARDPATGQRGITAMTGWVTRVVQDWATMVGEVEVALHGEDQLRRTVYSPAAYVDTGQGTNGYDHANKRVHLVANTFSLATEGDDVTNFEVDDKVRVIERSPADPTTPTQWADTVAAVGASYVDLTTGLGAADALAGANYYLISDDYATAQSTQQVDCYIGDDADGNIVDTARNRLYIQQPFETGSYTTASANDRAEWPCTDGSWGSEGEPVTPILHRSLVYAANNLVNNRTNTQCPPVMYSTVTSNSTSYVVAMFPFKYYIGRGKFAGFARQLELGAVLSIANGASTATARITSSATRPILSGSISGTMTASFAGAKAQVTTGTDVTTRTNCGKASLPLMPATGDAGYTWITVELLSSNASHNASFYGFHQWALSGLA